jgi:hypothetical protein
MTMVKLNGGEKVYGVKDGDERAGTGTWWRLSGGVTYEAFKAAWLAQGLPEKWLPNPTTPMRALVIALHEQAGQRRLVRPLAQRGRYSLVAETAEGDTLDYGQDLTASVDKDGILTITPAWHPRADDLRKGYHAALDVLATNEISLWLARLADKVQAVPLRIGGGIYFVPPTATEMWDRAAKAIESVTAHAIYQMPVMKSDDVVRAVLDALRDDTNRELGAIADEIAATPDLPARSLNARVRRCDVLLTRLGAYESLLGDALVAITEQVDSLRADIASAALLADDTADDTSGVA